MFIFRKKIISDFFKKIFSPSRSVIQSKEYLFMKSQIKVCKDILNVGSSSKTVLGKNFFKILAEDSKIINLDIKQGSNVDIVADAMNMPIKEKSYDMVICQAVLEHISNPQKAIAEIKRVLKPNGILYCTIPFLQGYHADPYDYQRLTLKGGELLLKDFKIIKKGVSSGPFSSISWIIRDLFTFGNKNTLIYNATRMISSLIVLPLSFIDLIFPRVSSFTRNASEYYYLAQKK